MLIPTSNILLQQKLKKEGKYQNANTLKIDFRKMALHPSSDEPYTQCQYCPGIVLEKDSTYEKIEEQFHWHCQFCKRKNITTHFHPSQGTMKHRLQKNIANQILPPILLFVLDCSGSMGQSICVHSKSSQIKQEKLITLSAELKELMEKSQFCKKQQQFLKQFQQQYLYEKNKQKYKKYGKMKGDQYQSKISFFMSIIQSYLRESHKEKLYSEYRVGFIFFNQGIYILKGALQKTIPVIVPTNPTEKQYPYKKQAVNFQNFDELFQKGREFDRYFGDSQLKNLNLSKVAFQNLKIQHQTALGPALAFALGIISVHDIGSRIILVTDELPNKGLLSSQDQEQNLKVYEKMLGIMREKKITLGILNCFVETVSLRKKDDILKTQFERNFVKADADIVTEISLRFTGEIKHSNILNMAKKAIKGLLDNNSFGEKVDIDLIINNENVKVKQLKYDLKSYSENKFIGLTAENWVELNVDKIKQVQALFPIVTQFIVKYNDVITKQKCLFMSSTSQKIIKHGNNKEQVLMDVNLNKNNLREIEDLEKVYLIDRIQNHSFSSNLTVKSYNMFQIREESEDFPQQSVKHDQEYEGYFQINHNAQDSDDDYI